MSRCLLSVTALCAMLVATTALAQGGGGRGGMGGMGAMLRGLQTSGAMLLVNADVQKELGLTDDQLNQLQTAQNEMGNDLRPAIQSMFNMGQDEAAKAMADVMKKVDDRVAKILKPEQVARLKELQLQSQGANALVGADVVAKLKITDDQKAKIQKIIDDGTPQFGGFDPNQPAEDRQTAQKRMQDQREKVVKDALAVLTDDQLVQWAEMTGKEFKFTNNMGGLGGMMGFGGRGNRGGGAPNGGN